MFNKYHILMFIYLISDANTMNPVREDVPESDLQRYDCGETEQPIHKLKEEKIEPSKAKKITRKTKRNLQNVDKPIPKRAKIDEQCIENIRYKNVMHMPQFDARENAMRCKFEGCTGKTHFYCKSCKVHLCIVKKRNCFEAYHTESDE